jgi:hypothetical protein
MINQQRTTLHDARHARTEGGVSHREPTRDEEEGEASEPDAPTAGEETTGMNTILDGDLGTGIQQDADDE